MVQGLESLNLKLKKKIPEASRRRLRAAMKKGAIELNRAQKRLSPVDEGDLRSSISWRWTESRNPAAVRPGTLSMEVYAGSGDAFYGYFQEFGTRKMPPTPFFYTPYRSMKTRIKRRWSREIKKGIQEGAR